MHSEICANSSLLVQLNEYQLWLAVCLLGCKNYPVAPTEMKPAVEMESKLLVQLEKQMNVSCEISIQNMPQLSQLCCYSVSNDCVIT